jgi:hypothetical protein
MTETEKRTWSVVRGRVEFFDKSFVSCLELNQEENVITRKVLDQGCTESLNEKKQKKQDVPRLIRSRTYGRLMKVDYVNREEKALTDEYWLSSLDVVIRRFYIDIGMETTAPFIIYDNTEIPQPFTFQCFAREVRRQMTKPLTQEDIRKYRTYTERYAVGNDVPNGGTYCDLCQSEEPYLDVKFSPKTETLEVRWLT